MRVRCSDLQRPTTKRSKIVALGAPIVATDCNALLAKRGKNGAVKAARSRWAGRCTGRCTHPKALDRSTLRLDLLPRVSAGTVGLLEDEKLLREFRGFERWRGAAGRDRVDHRPGQLDDRPRIQRCSSLLPLAFEVLTTPDEQEPQ